MATLKDQCDAALSELGLPISDSYAQASDTTAAQVFSLWNALGQELYEQFRWKDLEKTFDFYTELDREAYPLPADWAGPIDQTEWDKTNHWSLIGQATPQQWQVLKSGIVALGPRLRYRYVNNTIELFPTPTTVGSAPFAPYHLSFLYYASGWVVNQDDVTGQVATTDAAVSMFRNRLMVNGVKLKLWQIKGFDVTTLQKDYDTMFQQAMGRDQGAPRLSLSPRVSPIYIGVGNIADGNWPVP